MGVKFGPIFVMICLKFENISLYSITVNKKESKKEFRLVRFQQDPCEHLGIFIGKFFPQEVTFKKGYQYQSEFAIFYPIFYVKPNWHA